MTNATAKKYGLKTISDLKKVGAFKLGGFPECQTRNTCFVGYTKQYGLSKASVRLGRERLALPALDAARCSPPTCSRPIRRSALRRSTRCSPIPSTSRASRTSRRSSPTSVATAAGPTFASTVNAVSAKLTLPAIIAMNKAVEVDKQSAATVAKAFLKANGLG